MSTKTVTKRIALAATVALGAGVLSLVSVTSAHAAGTVTIRPNAADGVTYAVSTSVGSAYSAGLLQADTTTALASTATLLSTGVITVANASGSAYDAFTVTGGIITNTAVGSVSADGTFAIGAGSGNDSISIKPASGSTQIVIKAYEGLASGATSAAGFQPVANITVTVASASVAGTPSVANSGIYYDSSNPTGGSSTALTADDATAINTNYYQGNQPWTRTQYAQVVLLDGYKAVVTSSASHLVTATATGGALVGISGTGTSSASTVGSSFSAAASTNGTWSLAVADPTSAPLTTTVTIAYDGVTIGTKTFVFTGPVSKIVLTNNGQINLTGKTGKTTKAVSVATYDAAGNTVHAVSGDVAYPTASFAAASTNPSTSAIGLDTTSGHNTATAVYADWTCAPVIAAHTDTVAMKYTNLDGSVVTSNAISVSCAGAPDTYKIKLDKASYNSGEVATLTVNFLDSKGNIAADVDSSGTAYAPFSGYTTTNPQVSVSGGSLAANVTTADSTSLGATSYRILVGTTSGTYQQVVNVTSLTAADATVQTVPLVISSGGTSLNDVLKGIVSLIASINKQIAALAKLVTKK